MVRSCKLGLGLGLGLRLGLGLVFLATNLLETLLNFVAMVIIQLGALVLILKVIECMLQTSLYFSD